MIKKTYSRMEKKDVDINAQVGSLPTAVHYGPFRETHVNVFHDIEDLQNYGVCFPSKSHGGVQVNFYLS